MSDSGRRRARPGPAPAQAVTLGITDLMTSLAIMFILLLVVFANARPSAGTSPPRDPGLGRVRAVLERASSPGLTLEQDPRDPQALRVVIPDTLLTFEFGRSTLTPAADRFLAELMPAYAMAMCGPLRDRVAAFVIEGHTDDLGDDVLNLRLSQERSFRVLVRSLDAVAAAAPEAHACFSALASASGRGKQDLVYDDQHRPDRELSRRVVFKILVRPASSDRARAIPASVVRP